jgi:imidazolonepropionase
MTDLLVTGIGQLVTNDPHRRGLLGIIEDAAVVTRDGSVVWCGPESDLPRELRSFPELDADGRMVIPGFVDCHTHALFGGNRADEFARRLAGETYEDIMAAGGGINATVRATRAAPTARLVGEGLRRLQRMLGTGTTTVEIKSGYGLDVATELRLLEAAASLADLVPADIVPTFLGAHVVPPEFATDRDEYVQLVIDEMLPAVAGRARFCDVFCDKGAFTIDEARRILRAAADRGLRPRLHAEQLARTGGAALAAELGAASADHLDHVAPEDLPALREAGTVAVLLPTVSLSLQTPPPPARLLWDAGIPVALATDCNPGTSNVENMQLVVALATLTAGLTADEALWAATRGGAQALELDDRGWIGPGAIGDLVMLEAETHLEIPYRPGTDLVRMVVKRSQVVVS